MNYIGIFVLVNFYDVFFLLLKFYWFCRKLCYLLHILGKWMEKKRTEINFGKFSLSKK